jgi:hypothetical protein
MTDGTAELEPVAGSFTAQSGINGKDGCLGSGVMMPVVIASFCWPMM